MKSKKVFKYQERNMEHIFSLSMVSLLVIGILYADKSIYTSVVSTHVKPYTREYPICNEDTTECYDECFDILADYSEKPKPKNPSPMCSAIRFERIPLYGTVIFPDGTKFIKIGGRQVVNLEFTETFCLNIFGAEDLQTERFKRHETIYIVKKLEENDLEVGCE